MRWVNEEKARYYQARLTEDLFGDWPLIMARGRQGHRPPPTPGRIPDLCSSLLHSFPGPWCSTYLDALA